MSNIHFSLTENVIINPILLHRSTPLVTPENPLTLAGRIGYLFESEVVTRIIAIATSLFAATDFIAHLGIGIVKGAHLGLRKMGVRCLSPAPTGEEVGHHFKQSAKFLGITLIGSIAATVWPGVVKYFKAIPLISGGTTNSDWKSTSDTVQKLWSQTADKNTFVKLWGKAPLNDRRTFVRLLDKERSRKGVAAKLELVDTMYRAITYSSSLWPKQNDSAVFYHATSMKGLEGILRTGKIEVRHEKAFRGAFVSTEPETSFGKYILVFNRTIERMSHLNHGFQVGSAYWAGFSHDIPVNATTLSRILVDSENKSDVSLIKNRCNTWAGRKIKVKRLSSQNRVTGDTDIPKEWPVSDPRSNAIQMTIQIRAKQQQPVKVKQARKAKPTAPRRKMMMMAAY